MFRNIRSSVKGSTKSVKHSMKNVMKKGTFATAALMIGFGLATASAQAQVINPFLVAPQQNVSLPPVASVGGPAAPQYPTPQYPAPQMPQQPPQQAPQQTPQQAPQTAGGRLDIDQLGQVLDLVQAGKNTIVDNGHKYYSLTVHQGTWTIPLTIDISPSGNVVWISTTLTKIQDPSRVSTTALMNLLQKNADLGPMYFQIVGNNHEVQLTEPIGNFNLNADSVRGRIADFIQTIQQTESLWSQEALTGQR